MWFFLALCSALFAAVGKTTQKQLSHQLNHFTIGWTTQLMSLPLIIAVLVISNSVINPLALGSNFWLPTVVLWCAFYPLSNYLAVTAIKHGELSKILPLQSLGPIFALLIGWMLLHQIPSYTATAGICIVIIGVYILNLKSRYLHSPLAILKNNKANIYMILNLILIAFAGVLNSVAIRASNAIYYSFVTTLGAVPLLFALSYLFNIDELQKVKINIAPLSVTGSLFGASFMANMAALSLGPLAYVSSVKSTSILFGALIGIFYLKESLTKPKLTGLLLIAAGSVIIAMN